MKKVFKNTIILLSVLIIGIIIFLFTMGRDLNYIGLSLEQGQRLAVKNGTILRAISIDGEPQMTTKDYRIGRINAIIIDGIVSEVSIEGEGLNK